MIKPGRWTDVAGLAHSAGCLVHCLLLPLAASLLPLLAAAEQAEWVHWLFAALAVPASLWALRRPHGAQEAAAVLQLGAAAGLSLLVAGAAGWPCPTWETPLTVAGALVLASVHVVNGLFRRSDGSPDSGAPPAAAAFAAAPARGPAIPGTRERAEPPP